MRGLSLVAASGGYSSLWCTGFSLRWLLSLRSTGSRHVGFSSCGARALLLRGLWDIPRPGLEPMSPALAGGFLTTVPPGKPHLDCFKLTSSSTPGFVCSHFLETSSWNCARWRNLRLGYSLVIMQLAFSLWWRF